MSRDQHQTQSRSAVTSGKTRPPPTTLLETLETSPSSVSEQDKKVLRWFRKHDFGRLWEIDCDFKLRHKVGMVPAVALSAKPEKIETHDQASFLSESESLKKQRLRYSKCAWLRVLHEAPA